MNKINIIDLGLVDYINAWDIQKDFQKQVQNERNGSFLIVCQHPTVITMGKNGTYENLKLSVNDLKIKNIEVIDVNRGGDVTLHNPEQLVAYPIFDLSSFKEDLHWFLRSLENVIINTVKSFGIESGRVQGLTGVWVENERKICAMGLHCSKWVTSHGIALNINNNISEFDYIIPCGIEHKKVTSISQEIGTKLDFKSVEKVFLEEIEKEFLEK